MPRPTQNAHSLARGRVRASMNKYNLLNLYKKTAISYQGKSLFQQKWTAKQETRAYHGEHLTEGRFKTIFDGKLESVAQLDASLKGVAVPPTPVSLQTYSVLEKRLEFAVFRAMFASSIRQAREFVLGGHVSVNGVTVKHPSFPLRAGDVFHVTPTKVLLAMGRSKPSVEKAVKVDNKQIATWNKHVKTARELPREVWQMRQLKPASLGPGPAPTDAENGKRKRMLQQQKETTRESILAAIIAQKDATEASFSQYGENASKCLTVFTRLLEAKHELLSTPTMAAAKEFVSRKSPDFSSPADAKFALGIKQILGEIVRSHVELLRKSSQTEESGAFSADFGKNLRLHPKLDKDAVMEDESVAQVNLPWQKGLFGRQEPSKPYFTPWTPRPFIGAFAVLPSYIEVSFSTCHAVYMREPVARPGHSEVISPLPDHAHERAYMYYARKGL